MKTFKKITQVATLIGLLSLNAKAVDLAVQVPGNSYTNLLLSAATVSQFIFANADATHNANITFYDAGTTNFYVTNAAYTTTSYSVGQVTNIYTNYFGVLTTNIFSGLITTLTTNAANTNFLTAQFNIFVPSNSTLVVNGTYRYLQGILATNSAAATVTVTTTYR